jgi:hypothetical protein
MPDRADEGEQMKYDINVLCIALLGAIFTSGCGPTKYNLKARKAEVQKLHRSIKTARSAKIASARYAEGLKGKQTKWIAFSKETISRAIASYLPYRYRGKDLSKKRLRGAFWFGKPSKLKLHAGNRLTYSMRFGAKQVVVNLKGVFGAGKSDAREIKEALQGGGELNMDVTMQLNGKNGQLLLFSNCTAVKLNKRNTSRNRKYLRQAINSKLFKFGCRVALPEAIKRLKGHLLTTANHVVIVGR